MKLILLGADQGTRINEGAINYLPKPLHSCVDKSLANWALQSFMPFFTLGDIKFEDVYIVLQQNHEEMFKISEKLKREFSRNLNFIHLHYATSGPLETLSLALKELESKNFDLSKVVVSDIDHYFVLRSFPRIIDSYMKNDEKSIVLLSAKKDENDLGWCHYKTNENGTISLIEKPSMQESADLKIDLSRGVVGVYSFLNVTNLASNVEKFLSQKRNAFLSDFINHVSDVKIAIHELEHFFPMGNRDQLKQSEIQLSNSIFLQGGKTIFVDIDGTLVKHESGRDGYERTPNFLDNKLITLLKDRFKNGDELIFTTSRPKTEEHNLRTWFEACGLPNVRLISNLPNGPRVLLNDLKPSNPIPMANSYNLIRDFIHPKRENQLREALDSPNFAWEISGGSGVKSYLMKNSHRLIFAKVVDKWSGKEELIKYQYDWLKFVSFVFPSAVPSNLSLVDLGDLVSFQCDYMDDLVPLGEFLRNTSSVSKIETINQLKLVLEVLYSHTSKARINLEQKYLEVLQHKVTGNLQSIEFNLLSLLAEKSIKEVVLPFLKFKIENLSTILRGMDRTLRNLSRKISKIDAELCLIHGDATFENLAYSESRGIMLLNPIGARIDPCFKRKSTELGYAAKIFDQSRMFLTSKWNYDIWNISLRAHVENNVLSISENVSFHDAQFFEVVDTLIWDDLLYPQATRDDVMAFAIIDLVRILRYKIGARDLPQALWIIGLLERELGIEL